MTDEQNAVDRLVRVREALRDAMIVLDHCAGEGLSVDHGREVDATDTYTNLCAALGLDYVNATQQQIADAILSQREPCGDGWQPIETCPQRTMVDLFVRDADTEGAGYRLTDVKFIDDGGVQSVRGSDDDDYRLLMEDAQYATHWMPAPADAPLPEGEGRSNAPAQGQDL